jgi:virginiamycin B lyase
MSADAHSAPLPRDRRVAKYALVLLAVTLLASLLWGFAQRADASIYYANSSRLGRVNLDGTGANGSFITGLSSVAGVALNEDYVYWSSNISGAGNGKISRAHLDGSDPEVLITGATNPQAIAIDGTYIYWGNAGSVNTIGRAKLDGTEVNQSFITGANVPNGIAVDAAHIYWTNNGGNTIGRANIDGTGAVQNFITGANGPLGVAVDAEHIYWANFGGAGGTTIGRANLDGTGKNQNFITGAEAPRSVAVDGTHIYWSNFGFGGGTTYGRANIDGTGANDEFIKGASAPFGIATNALRGSTTTVACEPGLVGRAKTCTATVTDTEGGVPAQPTGTVAFSTTGTGAFEAGGTCTLAAGAGAGESTCTATYTPAELGTGKETITAKFAGDPTAASSSGTTELTVAMPVLPTATTVACTPNPVFVNSVVSCTATVTDTESGTPEQPTGTVAFSTTGTGAFEGDGTCTLAGSTAAESTCTLTYTPAEVGTGKETITANFAGGPTADPSSGTMELTIAAATSTTATTVSCTPNPVYLDGEASCTATVTGISGAPAVPSGTVTFSTTGTGAFAGGGTCTLAPTVGESAACSVAYTPAEVGTGKETITADYGGSPSSDPSSGTMELTIAVPPTATTVACTPNQVYANVEASCAATVTDTSGAPTAPTGQVTFKAIVEPGFEEGTFPDGTTCTLVAQGATSASCQVRYVSNLFGTRPIEAKYGGSSSHQASVGHGSLEILRVHKTKSTLACATESPVVGAPDACTFTVIDSESGTSTPFAGSHTAAISPAATAPTGTVTFASDSGGAFDPATCTVAPVDAESASCTATFTATAKGIIGISASFDGAPAYQPTSATAALKVGAAPAGPQSLTCAPGFAPTGDPPVCRQSAKPVQTEAPKPKAFSRSRPTLDRTKGTATLPLYLPGPGRVLIRGAGIAKVTHTVTAAGPLRVLVRAAGSARRTLRREGHVALHVQVIYTPTGGKARTMKVPVRLVLAGKNASRSH